MNHVKSAQQQEISFMQDSGDLHWFNDDPTYNQTRYGRHVALAVIIEVA